MKTLDQMRLDIGDWICHCQSSDCYNIGNAVILWVSCYQEYLLQLPNGKEYYDNNGFELVNLIDDLDILDFYPEIAEYYEEVTE
jgi:hypothetical protein